MFYEQKCLNGNIKTSLVLKMKESKHIFNKKDFYVSFGKIYEKYIDFCDIRKVTGQERLLKNSYNGLKRTILEILNKEKFIFIINCPMCLKKIESVVKWTITNKDDIVITNGNYINNIIHQKNIIIIEGFK